MEEIFDGIQVWTVKEFTYHVQSILESEFSDVWISGEISNFTDHKSSGHAYFSLKDETAIVKGVMFRFNRSKVKFDIEDGLKVKVHGAISIYPKRGEYQIIVDFMEPEGIGGLQLAFLQLKERLEKEGLFDMEHKKGIPPFPERIGVVTSPTGAAIRDILNILNRRFSSVDILIYPAQVQGDLAGQEIARQIDLANNMDLVDVLIVGRGGGSIEDLWPFNEEIVARAIYRSKLPIISAVGHEVDYTISDYVADMRAPTPSAAAELVVTNREEILEYIHNLTKQMTKNIDNQIKYITDQLNRFQLDTLSRGLIQRIDREKITLDHLNDSLASHIIKQFDKNESRFKVLYEKLLTLGPLSTLKRGYSLVYLLNPDGSKKIIKRARDLKPNDLLTIQLQEGNTKARVE